jgi:hypothetical protein
MKVMVQAGVRKVYYFPAEKWELGGNQSNGGTEDEIVRDDESSEDQEEGEEERKEKNKRSVMRLVSNNPIGMCYPIPLL